jgi:hypothetical protein
MAIPAGWWHSEWWPGGRDSTAAQFAWWPEKWFQDNWWPDTFWGVWTYDWWHDRWWPRFLSAPGTEFTRIVAEAVAITEAIQAGFLLPATGVAETLAATDFIDRSLEVGTGGDLFQGTVTETFDLGELGYRFGSLLRDEVLVTDVVVGELFIPAAISESLNLAQDDERIYSTGEVTRSEFNVTVFVRSTTPYVPQTLSATVSETVRFRLPGGRSGDRPWVPRDIDEVVPDFEADLPIREE